jgi:HPt (histidine-containing phosphotransfer) domain-containing protein
MTTFPIDRPTFEQLRDSAGEEFVRELVDTFCADAPTMLAELRRTLAAGDAQTFRRTAHSFKSNANTFGALALGAQAKALELAGMEPVRAANGAPLVDLEREYARVAAALTELARG